MKDMLIKSSLKNIAKTLNFSSPLETLLFLALEYHLKVMLNSVYYYSFRTTISLNYLMLWFLLNGYQNLMIFQKCKRNHWNRRFRFLTSSDPVSQWQNFRGGGGSILWLILMQSIKYSGHNLIQHFLAFSWEISILM